MAEILENIITFNEINEKRITLLKQLFINEKYNLNITNYDFLKFPNNIKYDLQIANPPYAKFCETKDKDGNTVMLDNKTFVDSVGELSTAGQNIINDALSAKITGLNKMGSEASFEQNLSSAIRVFVLEQTSQN